MSDKKKCECQQTEELKRERDSLLERLLDTRRQLREETQKTALMIRQSEEVNRAVDAVLARLAEVYGEKDSTPGGGIVKGYSLMLTSVDVERLLGKYAVHAARGSRKGDYRIVVTDRKYEGAEGEKTDV